MPRSIAGTSPRTWRPACETCRAAGLTNISLDLIFGIPSQTLDSWQASLWAAADLQPEHFSAYGLTYHPGTELWLRRETGAVEPVDPDCEADMYELLLDFLPGVGLEQYEISNFARPDRECRHNIRYWLNEPYLGVGPSAAGFVDGVRYTNTTDLSAYISAARDGRPARAEAESLTPDRRLRESAMLALRMTAGINRAAFRARFGSDPAEIFADAIRKHVADGLLVFDEESIRLTRAGLLLANTVMMDFV